MKITKQRAPKFKRKPQQVGGLRVQKRDIEIIRLVYDYRFLNSDQIQALVNGSEQGILRRLQKLFHHGFLDRPPSQIVYPLTGTQKMVYALGDKGADFLANEFGIDRGEIKWNEKNKEVKDRHIQHTLMISNFRLSLKLALDKTSNTDLLFWQRENRSELKDYAYTQDKQGRQRKIAIVPDGFFGLKDTEPKPNMYFFLEADQGTMDNARFLRKMRAYWVWGVKDKGHAKNFGIKSFRVLTITKSEQRKENLRKTTKNADDWQKGSPMFWFTSEQNYNMEKPESILKPIWQTAKDDRHRSLLD